MHVTLSQLACDLHLDVRRFVRADDQTPVAILWIAQGDIAPGPGVGRYFAQALSMQRQPGSVNWVVWAVVHTAG